MKVSLLLSVYNRKDYLTKCLCSIAHQSIVPDETILCDDGSSEDIESEAVKFASGEGFPSEIIYVRQEHKGFRLAKNRNNGIKNSSGDLLIFLDSDLLLTKDYVKVMIDNIREGVFLTSYPVRLTKEQSEKITLNEIKDFSFLNMLEKKQVKKIKKQYRKDLFYFYFDYMLPRAYRVQPKLRGGACAILKKDLIAINGYDENYVGWGNEDDNLSRRLYMYGLRGYNPSYNDFPIHLWHEPYHQGKRLNMNYHQSERKKIERGNWKCENGLFKTREDDEIISVKKIYSPANLKRNSE